MRVVSLGSGSSGNALLVEAGPRRRTKLLIDAGLSARTIIERLSRVSVEPSELRGILLTHEHSDHVIGLATLLKRYTIPLIADTRTYSEIEQSLVSGVWHTDSGSLSLVSAEPITAATALETRLLLSTVPLAVGTSAIIGDIEVTSFATSHDAVAPCGYLLSAGGCRVCIVTDTGEVTADMLNVMRHADLLIIEANHDRERLLRGPYPRQLKERILSPIGHLSNDQAADAVLHIWRSDSIRWLWLAHLSRTNNTPTLALESIKSRFKAARANLTQIHLSALPPDMGRVWDSTELWRTSALWEI